MCVKFYLILINSAVKFYNSISKNSKKNLINFLITFFNLEIINVIVLFNLTNKLIILKNKK